MGKFDTQIEKAKKVAEGWKKEAERYKTLFTSLKKDRLAPQKEGLRRVQEGIQKGQHKDNPNVVEEFEGTIGRAAQEIAALQKEGQHAFDALKTWEYHDTKGPRHNMRSIKNELKLGSVTSEDYLAVAAATKTQLTDVATVLADAENLWMKDVKFALETLATSAETAKKLLTGARTDLHMLRTQFGKEVSAFAEFCDQLVRELKVEAGFKDFQDIKSGNINEKTPLSTYVNQAQVYAKRLETNIPEALKIAEKNYERVRKSVPPGLLNTLLANAPETKSLTKRMDYLRDQFKAATKLFTQLLEMYKQKGWIK